MLFLGSVTLTGFDEAAGAVIKDATGLGIENAFERLRAEAAAQFATQGSAFGSPWPPRNPDRSPGRPLLVLTGRLRGSWTDQENPEHVEEILAAQAAKSSDYSEPPSPTRDFTSTEPAECLEDRCSLNN